MIDKRQRTIATLEVERVMTEAHAKRTAVAANCANPEQQRDITALAKEETERAELLSGTSSVARRVLTAVG